MNESRRLRKADMEMLAHACVFRSNGGDLSSIKKFAEYLVEVEFFKGDLSKICKSISVCKTKMAKKQWIIGGRGVFELQGLDFSDKSKLEYSISFNNG